MANSLHVLVVEDDPDVAEYLRLVLVKRAGMRVELAADIQVAEVVLRRLEIDVLLTDIELPGCSGFELANLARELVPLIPVAVMTAHTSADYAVTANRCHADEFLVKPVRAATLISTVTLLAQLGRDRHRALGAGRQKAEAFG
jgi:DNA-binding NtrC family response regulator